MQVGGNITDGEATALIRQVVEGRKDEFLKEMPYNTEDAAVADNVRGWWQRLKAL